MAWSTIVWLVLGGMVGAFEAYGLAADHRYTLSQTLQRLVRHARYITLAAWVGFSAWFAHHIWGSLL